MKTTNYKQIALIAALVIAIITTGFYLVNNSKLKKDLKTEKLSSEALLSEKLILDKSLDKLKADLNELKGKNLQLDKKIGVITKELESKEGEYKRAIADNASFRAIKAKAKGLENLNAKLSEELKALKEESKRDKDKLAQNNEDLSKQLATVRKDFEQLSATNSILRAMAGNNHRVEAVRGKSEKQTLRARRAQKLIFSFDLPSDVGNAISFKLKCPDNIVYESKDNKNASVEVIKNPRNFFENNQKLGITETKTVELEFTPEEKLKKGEYEFMVYNDDGYIGSSRFRLK